MRALRRVIKGLKRVIKGLMLLLVIALAALAILLGSAGGISWLVRTADERIPGDLRVEKVTGSLFGDLRIDGFHYSDSAVRVEAGSLVLRWTPAVLLQRRLHIVRISVADGRFERLQAAGTEAVPESGEPPILPDIELPLALILDQVTVAGFTLIAAPGAEPLVLEKLLLRATAEGSEIDLDVLEVVLRDMVELRADGRVRVAGDWPLVLHNALRSKLPDLPGFALVGEVSGDLQRLRLQQTVSGGVEAQLHAEVKEPLGRLRWTTGLSLSKLSDEVAKLAGIALPAVLSAELNGDGDLQRANAAIELRLGTSTTEPAVDGGGVAATASVAAPPPPAGKPPGRRPATIELTGSLQFEQLQFQAKGRWQGLQWPLVGPAQVVTESGGLEAEGSLDDYRFSLKARVDGPGIPPGTWSAHGSGSDERVRLDTLQGEVLGGRLQAQARVAWAPRLEWQARVSGNAIDPGRIAPEWPGSLEFALRTTGSIEEGQRRIGVVIEKLAGRLRDLPVAGAGEFHMDGADMVFQEIELSSGKAVLKADGRLQAQWDLDWTIDVADLADLLPQAQGRIQAEGKLTGNAELPNVRAKLAVEGVRFQELQLQRLDGDIDLGLGAEGAGGEGIAIKLRARGLGGGDLVETLSLDVSGPLTAQSVRLAAAHPLGTLALDAEGALDLDRSRWQGTLARLDLDAKEWGRWGLQSPAALSLSPEAVKAARLCLQEGGTALCAGVDWTPAAGTAQATLQGFSFDRLRPLLPEELSGLEGALNARLNATLGARIGADLELELEPGRIVYLLDEAHQVSLTYQGGGLKATYDRKALAAELQLKMGEGGIAARVRIPRTALDKDPLSAPLDGRLDFDFRQLGLLGALVPAIEKSEGLMHGELELGGVLGAPGVGGEVTLEMTALVIPDAGLDLKDLKLALRGKGTRLRLDGGVGSGPGRLELEGEAELDAAKGWPARLTLKGERFQAVALPEARVLISPDIRVVHGEQGLGVRGSITVPEADIHLHEIPRGSRTVSSDLVIVDSGGSEEESPSGMPIDAEVTVILGDRVRFGGFGLNADLDGRLTITQEPGSRPVGNGELGIVKGSFRSFGQELDIDRGRVFYAGGSLTNPGLNLQASRRIDGLTVGVLVTGTAKKPQIKAFSSDPTMKESDARSLLLTGTTEGSGDSASVYAGTNLTDKLSVGTNVSVDGGEKEFVARYKINNRLSLKTTSSSTTSGGELLYTIEFK